MNIEPLPAELREVGLPAGDAPPTSLGMSGKEDQIAELIPIPDALRDRELQGVDFSTAAKDRHDIYRIARQVEFVSEPPLLLEVTAPGEVADRGDVDHARAFFLTVRDPQAIHAPPNHHLLLPGAGRAEDLDLHAGVLINEVSAAKRHHALVAVAEPRFAERRANRTSQRS